MTEDDRKALGWASTRVQMCLDDITDGIAADGTTADRLSAVLLILVTLAEDESPYWGKAKA
jgi:hypothetical protein